MIKKSELGKGERAYIAGERPISRWGKKEFVAGVYDRLGDVPEWVYRLSRKEIFEFLKESGVCYTGNCLKFRNTTFYRIDFEKVMRRTMQSGESKRKKTSHFLEIIFY